MFSKEYPFFQAAPSVPIWTLRKGLRVWYPTKTKGLEGLSSTRGVAVRTRGGAQAGGGDIGAGEAAMCIHILEKVT